ncbi:MAG: lytic murein transglycosylase B [Sulfuritalea sp.]|nr:lytic murein transglycosylase B [Sulfuritalea sp.]
MIRLLLLLTLPLLHTHVHAETYAKREDVRTFVQDMYEKHGIEPEVLGALFDRTEPIPAVIKAIMPPKNPGARSWNAYRGRFIERARITAGRKFMQVYAKQLDAAEQDFGVPAEIIAAIIGIETLYGKHMGRFGTFAALTTLAFDYPPRADLFRHELEELLLLAREEDRNPLTYVGSYAGAIGLPQFLPSSKRRFALDVDGNGNVDLTSSRADAIGSVANYLAAHGWERGAPIADTISISGNGIQALIDEGIEPRLTPREMEQTGVHFEKTIRRGIRPGGTAKTRRNRVATLPNRPAALIDLVSPKLATEYRLGYRNFYVITRYNRSSFYAAAVMDLAATLKKSK